MEKPKFKTVQEVIAAGEGLPERYLHEPTGEGESQPLNGVVPEMDIPAIDLSLLFSSSEDGREELKKLHSALSTWGVVQIMSNGIYKSPVHRVVTNRERERISVATFCVPGPDKEIQPADGLVTEARPRLYKTVTKYVDLYYKYYQQGRRTIEAALI